ncbi:MAG: hypothetical protein WCA06_07340 [Terrimicrobiaceae bacterium]
MNRVSIVPRGQALGLTYQRPDSERYNHPEAYLRARIVGMPGGRAAEEIVYGTKTTGAESDIEQATGLARPDGHALGHERAVGMVQLAPRENTTWVARAVTRARGRSSRRPRKPSMPRCGRSSARVTTRPGAASPERPPQGARRARRSPAVAGTLSKREILEVTGLPSARRWIRSWASGGRSR